MIGDKNKSLVQEFFIPWQKFDRVQNCYLYKDTGKCIQTSSLKDHGYQDAKVDRGDYRQKDKMLGPNDDKSKYLWFGRKVIRASRKDEKYGDTWHAMKNCKLLCNDYAKLF